MVLLDGLCLGLFMMVLLNSLFLGLFTMVLLYCFVRWSCFELYTLKLTC